MRRFFQSIKSGLSGNQVGRRMEDSFQKVIENNFDVIYEDPKSTLDIVAVHGDGGHYLNSWTHPNGTFWLRDLLPSIVPNSRILSFSYPSSKSHSGPAQAICRSIMQKLVEARQDSEDADNRPIIFLAHSFGVLLVKAVVGGYSSVPEFGNVINCTQGLIFFGSPLDIGRSLQNMIASLPSNTNIASKSPDLSPAEADWIWLQDSESVYAMLESDGRFEAVYFLEGIESNRQMTYDAKEKYLRLGKSHGTMIQFSGIDDDDFVLVQTAIRRIYSSILR